MIRTLKITNIYENHAEQVTHVTVDLDTPEAWIGTGENMKAAYKQYLYDTIFPLTGFGHFDGNSAYFVESTDDLEPIIDEEYGT